MMVRETVSAVTTDNIFKNGKAPTFFKLSMKSNTMWKSAIMIKDFNLRSKRVNSKLFIPQCSALNKKDFT